MKSTILLLSALALAYQDPPKNMRFVAPEGAKPAEVQAAAKVIQKRCDDYGYKGMTVKVIDQVQVEVSCSTGITAVMRPKLTELATKPYLKLELMIEYVLTERENEQYEPGKTCPEGTQWIQLQEGKWRLIVKAFKMDLAGKIVWKRVTKKDRPRDEREPPDSYFEFKTETTKALRNQYKGEKGRDLLLAGC